MKTCGAVSVQAKKKIICCDLKMVPCSCGCSSGSVLVGELTHAAAAFLLHGDALAYTISAFLIGKQKW